MFGLSFFEMLILAGIALVVIGPKQLPELARVLGRFLSEMKKASAEVRGQFKVDLLGGIEELRADQKHILDLEPDKKSKSAVQSTSPAVGTPVDALGVTPNRLGSALEGPNIEPVQKGTVEKPPGEKT